MSLILQDSLVLSPQAKQQLQSDINSVNERLDTLEAASDCADVVGTKAELDSYNTSTLTDNSVIKVLQDESNGDTISYYRYSKSTNSFSLIGEIGPFYTKQEIDSSFNETNTNLTNHIDDKSNPHEVTKDQVGLGNVDNTSDANKPISTATQNALDQITTDLGNHIDDKENPHAVTKAQVGLDNVDNTSDLDKPISTATQTALDKKSTVIFRQW